MDLEEMKKALAALAEGDGEDAKKAKAALAALNGKAEHEEPDGDEPEAEGEEPDGDEEKPAKEETEDKGAKALAMVEGIKRDQLIAARPDLSADQRKALASVPLAALPGVLAAIPRMVSPVAAAQAALKVSATGVDSQGGTNTEADLAVSAALGLSNEPLVRREANTMTMRACSPEEARKHLASLEATR